MGQKRKPEVQKIEKPYRPEKKARQEGYIPKSTRDDARNGAGKAFGKDGGKSAGKIAGKGSGKEDIKRLVFAARSDWHAAELPALPLQQHESTDLPPQRVLDELHTYATTLLDADNATYTATHLSGSSSHKFLSTIMTSGTLEDKISALTLMVQESPLHTMKAFENLLGLSKKKSRNQALMAVAALKDLLGQGVVLPADRKLRAFAKQPALTSILQGRAARWSVGEPLPGGLKEIHLVVWAYEDWLKRMYFELLKILESWCGDEIEYSRSRAITYVWELLKDKPEQEENLLRLLVNKLGDTDRKIASRASYLLLQLQTTHPAMKTIIANSIEADCLFRPGQSLHARYYAIVTLNQTVLSQKEQEVANRLLDIFFSLFVQLLKPAEAVKPNTAPNGKAQGGGGVAGKAAAKKAKALERVEEADVQLKDKMMAQVLTGVNRAFPFADTSDPTFEKQIDTLFRVTHSANFSTAVQALMLLQQISAAKHYGAERYYRTLYESLLDPRLIGSSKQVMYLNLLYKSLKADLNAKRVQAFVKRLLQIITLHEPPFVCGVLYLITELETTFPSIRSMLKDPEIADEDEEEHFADVPDEDDSRPAPVAAPKSATKSQHYDPRARNPEYAHAERSCLWDMLPFLSHFHPSIQLFANALLSGSAAPPKPDPTQHTLMHFLDRFVYRTARSKASTGAHGSSIMQPMGGSSAADLLVKPGERAGLGVQINSEAFWAKKVENVAADEVFFHSYFQQAGSSKKSKKGAKAAAGADKKRRRDGVGSEDDGSGSDADGEDEIWKAIVNSKPEVEGGDDDEDDDLDMADLESAYSDSDDDDNESEGGIDLGGSDDEVDSNPELDGDNLLPLPQDDDDSENPDFEDDDEDAMFGDNDLVPFDIEGEAEETVAEANKERNKKKRSEKKKLKSLPTFATAEDYAKLIDQDGSGEEGMY
jgi:ribosome biogenesis protein MAK21